MRNEVVAFLSAAMTSMALVADRSKTLAESNSTYWVSPNGQASWQNARSETPLGGAAACSLATANANASAGDTVYLRGGSYSNGGYVRPQNSGASESARVVYSSYNDETAAISDADYGIMLDGKSYVTVNGLHFINMGHFLYIQNNAHHNDIGHCTFDQARNVETWGGSKVYYSSQYNRVHHCTFSRWGWYNGSLHRGALFDVGREAALDDDSFYNLIEENTFYYGGHHVLAAWGRYNVFRNNYMHNEGWELDADGYRCAISHGVVTGLNLFEGNRIAFAGNASGFSMRSWKNIFRFNMFYNNGLGGIQGVSMEDYTPANENRIYNNVFYNNGHEATYAGFSGGIYFADWGQGDPTGNVVKNNIFHGNAGGVVTFDAVVDPQIFESNWSEEGDPLFIYEGGPLEPFGDRPDFRLRPGSSCIDRGGYLTTITSASGSGSQFQVDDAGYFMDGWGVIDGDEIQLQDSTQRARILNIDYDTHTIEIDGIMTWTRNQGVSLSYRGNAPDLGAYEYDGPAMPTKLRIR
jgi:hypothetical protein